MTRLEFDRFRALARDRFGLDLRTEKQALVSARLGRKVRQAGLRTFRQYYEYVLADGTSEALREMIDALATNHTSFFREPAHFEFLRRLAAREFTGRARIEVWSAGCATGEEPYTIAICLMEALPVGAASRIHVLATDISTRALETAEGGVYRENELRQLPPGLLRLYFLRGEREWAGWLRVRPQVRRLVEFRRLNLMDLDPSGLPRFQAIFCRNVMIYFDRPTQEALVERLVSCLAPGGYLLTGHSESLWGGKYSLEYVQPAVYCKKGRT